ncbi:hypothetical protein AWENTII_012406 [Aspergillus wentii]
MFPSPDGNQYNLPGMGDMSHFSPHHSPDDSIGAPLIPQQSSYPSLFRSSVEIPRFFVAYRWWEDEATTVLWAFDVQEIKRVIRYGLFRDGSLPRTALQSRNATTIDTFLLTLVEPHERLFLANLSHVQKVEEILRRTSVTSSPLMAWSWFPSLQDSELDPRAIAVAIDSESHLHFNRISFEEWVRYSLGYSAAAVEWFFQQHTAFYIHLLNYLHSFPEEVGRYVEVEQHLRTRSPFAHRALVRCLLHVQAEGSSDMPLAPAPGFDFIAGPIQRLFKNSPPSLKSILKVLSVLGARFRRTYVHTPEMNWNKAFDTDATFIEDLLASTSALDFGRTLTTFDESTFAELNEQSIVTNNSAVKGILVQWDSLSMAVWECCSALPDLTPYILECLEALFMIRNYHSLTAILNGIQKYSISTLSSGTTSGTTSTVTIEQILPPESTYLLDSFENYAAYRQQFHEAPGIPFLLPHIRDFKQNGELALHQMFQDMQASIS